MIRTIAVLSALALAAPAAAQDHEDHAGHAAADAHDHAGHDHAGHDMAAAPVDNADIEAALAEGGALVTVDVLGMVCDFCATALNRTFERRAEVAAVYVDLDDKTLSVVVRAGADLDDAAIEDLVTRAGYRIEAIRRGEAAHTHGGHDAADHT